MKKFALSLALATTLAAIATLPVAAQDYPRTQLSVIGTFSNLTSYKNHEYPFWSERLPALTGGQVTAQIKGMNEMGIKGPELLRLIGSGVAMVGAAPINYFTGDNPMNEAVDLAGIAPDIQTARAVVDAFLPVYDKLYGERSNVQVLGMGTFPAQVLFCNKPVSGLADLKGLKVRVSGRSQAEFMQALGATGVTLPFAEVVPALQNGVVDCGLTGSHSGYSAKWYEVSTHLYTLPLGWSQYLYAVNRAAWNRLDPKVRALLQTEIKTMLDHVWRAAGEETQEGFACNTGSDACPNPVRGKMILVEPDAADRALLAKITRDETLPKWAARCSAQCVADFNATIGQVIGISAPTK